MRGAKSKYKESILKLREEGKKYREICEILKCSPFTIYRHLKDNDKLFNEPIEKNRSWRSSGSIRNRKIVTDYLESHPCIDCGNSDIRVLEFDHVRGEKVKTIANAVRDAWPEDKLLLEIDKCEIRCCNCHRIVTIERRNKNKPIITT